MSWRITFIIAYILLAISFSANAQKKYTLSGYLTDKSSSESVFNAGIYIREINKTILTNDYGFYSVTLDEGKYSLRIVYISYKTFETEIELTSDRHLNIALEPDAIMAEEVVITAEEDENIKGSTMGKMELDVQTIKNLPAFLGEADVMKTIQLLPGVMDAGEGNSGFYVRGGGPDQNLILLDEAVVYNASHLFGFFSIFNADAVSNIELYKGSMPAQYGGRLASVLDISMKEGNNKRYSFEGGIGLIASRFTVQGPIKKDTSSFIVSARRTYIDILMAPFIDKESPAYGSGYYFYDLNIKYNHKFSDKDRIYVSGYFGRDVFNFNDSRSSFAVKVPWGNATGTLRWNHLFNHKLFMNVSAIYSQYDFKFTGEQDQFTFGLFSGITNYNGKLDFSYYPNPRHSIKFGANYVFHSFLPNCAEAKAGDVELDVGGVNKLLGHETSLYVGDDFEVTDRLRINAGMRYSMFMHVGSFTRYVKDPTTNKNSDTLKYGPGDIVALYHGAEPRFSVRYATGKNSAVKASFTRNLQFIHLASLSAISLPTDVWVPSTDRVKPQKGLQYALGYFQNLFKGNYETSVEVYYKDMQNQIEYKEGALPDDDIKDNMDNNFTFGHGWSYGVEFFFKKRTGNLNGWIGYTLAWTKRQFDEINLGKPYYAKFDRRHDMNLALTYNLGKRWVFGTVFVYASGNAITLPNSWYLIENRIVYDYGERNSLRMPPYHRLDVSATLKSKEERKFKSSWTFAVYNVYNRQNPFFLYIDSKGNPYDGSLSIKAKQVSLFPILPSITWNFVF